MCHSNSSSISPGSSFFYANFSVPTQNLMVEPSKLYDYEQNQQELQSLESEIQHLSDTLQQKEALIQSLYSDQFKKQKKYQAKLRRFEHDMFLKCRVP